MVIEPDPVKVATVADYPRGHAQIADVKALRHPHADVQEK